MGFALASTFMPMTARADWPNYINISYLVFQFSSLIRQH